MYTNVLMYRHAIDNRGKSASQGMLRGKLRCKLQGKKKSTKSIGLHPDPVKPPLVPVFAMRVRASCWVVHAMEVPGEFTRGKAAQIKDPPHEVVTNFPPTH